MAHDISQRKSLMDEFTKLLHENLSGEINLDSSVCTLAADNIYKEMVRKLSNTRIQEFLSSQIASNKGHASMTGQNLRDGLLTQHANLQSRIKID